MKLNIEQLRAALAAKNSSGGEGNTGFWDKFYPFYKMDFDETAVFRFLPDADDENPLGFVVENKYHELLINGKKKKIACLNMYGETCPCCEASKKYYDEGDSVTGKAFWRKIDYVMQGLVINTPFDFEVDPTQNPVRLISVTTKLYKTIESKIVKGDMDELPFDMVNGYDFRINKTKQGEYADYSTSDFARKSTGIPAAFVDNLELYDLKKYRFAKIEREQMETMIEAFLTGKSYNDGDSQSENSTGNPSLDTTLSSNKETQSASSYVEQAAQNNDAPTEGKKLSPQEILAKLKAKG